jgi:hypothetical protein
MLTHSDHAAVQQ